MIYPTVVLDTFLLSPLGGPIGTEELQEENEAVIGVPSLLPPFLENE